MMKEQRSGDTMNSEKYANAPCTITYKTIRGKRYVVKSVYVGDKDIQTAILNIAEKKALREMGISCPTL